MKRIINLQKNWYDTCLGIHECFDPVGCQVLDQATHLNGKQHPFFHQSALFDNLVRLPGVSTPHNSEKTWLSN